jgi:hypothetical protein
MKIKPFCVKSTDLTDVELNIMLEKCAELGASICDWVIGFDYTPSNYYNYMLYNKDDLPCWGVDVCNDTNTDDCVDMFNANLLTKAKAFEMLGIHTQKHQINKPSWSDAPEWANYLAMDKDGAWYWYELKPVIVHDNQWAQTRLGRIDDAYMPSDKWRDSLEARPK